MEHEPIEELEMITELSFDNSKGETGDSYFSGGAVSAIRNGSDVSELKAADDSFGDGGDAGGDGK